MELERNSRRRACLTAGLLTAVLSVAALADYSNVRAAGDLSEYLNNPVRMLHGEVPYRDFWLLHPPGEVALPAAIYAAGFGVNGVLIVSACLNVAVGVGAWWIVRLVRGSDFEGALAGLLAFFAGVPSDYGGFRYLHAYFLCLLAAAGLLAWYFQRRSRWALFLAGAACGLGLCFKLYLAGACAAAALLAVLVDARRQGSRPRDSAGRAGLFIAGSLLAPLATCVAMGDVAPQMIYDVVVDSVSHATVRRPWYGFQIPEMWHDLVESIRQSRTSAAIFSRWFPVVDAGSLLVMRVTAHLAPFLVAALWIYCRARGLLKRDAAGNLVFFFLAWGAFAFFRGFSRGGNWSPLAQSVTPLYLVLAVLLGTLARSWRQAPTRGLSVALACAVVAAIGLAQRGPVDTLPRVRLALLGGYVVDAPYGRLTLDDAGRAAVMQELITQIVQNSLEDEYVFMTPWHAPPLYALTRRRNPTYYDSLIDLTHRPSEEKQRRICAALLEKETRLVIHRRGERLSSGTIEELCPILCECLDRNFDEIARAGECVVLRRRAASDSPSPRESPMPPIAAVPNNQDTSPH